MADTAAGEDDKNEREWTITNYCLKKASIRSEIKTFESNQVMQVGSLRTEYEILETNDNEFVYVKNCPKDFKRVGNSQCVAQCPLGWPDFGHKCLKKGDMIYFPFVWMPGDGRVAAKEAEKQ